MSGYENYTLSPVPWIKQMPEHWGLVRGKNLYQKMQRPTSDTDEVVTCFRDGTVTLRKNRRTTGFTESLKEIGYQGIRKGDLVIHVMDAFAGSIGVSDSDGKGTPVYSVCQAKGNWNDADNVRRQILEIPAMVSKDEKYQNAMRNSDEQSARLESERALQQVIFSIMADNMELFKQFQDNPSFKKWLSDLVFNLTYNKDGKPYENPDAASTD